MVEEMTNATVAVPWSLMLTVLINGTLGFSMLIALYFCLGDIETSLKSPTGVPFLSIFYQATESTAGTAAAGSVIQAMCCCTTVGMLASASRQFWSFSRDRGIPGWRVWSKVNSPTPIPQCSPRQSSKEKTGNPPHRNPNLHRPPNQHNRLPPELNQHRLRRRLQQPRLNVYLRPVPLLHDRRESTPLPPLHRRNQSTQEKLRTNDGQHGRRQAHLGSVSYPRYMGYRN